MSDIEEKPRPGLRFLWLTIVSLILGAVIAGGVIWSDATTTPKLALDLEGGTSIILEPQVSEDTSISKEQLDQAVAIIRQRVDSTGVSEAEITTQGDRNIVVNLPGNPDEETRNLVRSSAQLVFRRVALVGDPRAQEQIDQEQQPSEDGGSDGDDGLTDEERKRLEDLIGGDQEPPAGGGAVVNSGTAGNATAGNATAESAAAENSGTEDDPSAGGTVPGPAGKDASETGEESGGGETPAGEGSGDEVTDSTPRPLFDPQQDTAAWQTDEIIKRYTELDCTDPKNRTGGEQQPADQPVVSCAQDGMAKYILGPVELSGDHLTDANFGYSTGANGVQTNQPAVNLEFDDTGREIFKQITSVITGLEQPYNQFAIALDGLVLSAPTSNAVITDGRAEISGNFTLDSAQTLANQLKNGSLPISFQVQSEEQISPTLGANFLNIGLFTGFVGLLLVVVYSLLQYRVLGLVTVSSLVVAGVLTYLLLLLVSWRYGYRLSLAGVAGIIIGIVAAADSFIVYFERVRDELRSGRKLVSAVEVGWDRAKRTIYASKAVNFLAALILYILAVGSVRGFAFTLGLTVIIDVLVVFLFTHPMLQVLSRTKFFGEGHRMSGMDPRLLGVKPAAYRGALGIDFDETEKTGEAKRRNKSRARKSGMDGGDTIAERRAKAAAAEAGASDDSATGTRTGSAKRAGRKTSGADTSTTEAGGGTMTATVDEDTTASATESVKTAGSAQGTGSQPEDESAVEDAGAEDAAADEAATDNTAAEDAPADYDTAAGDTPAADDTAADNDTAASDTAAEAKTRRKKPAGRAPRRKRAEADSSTGGTIAERKAAAKRAAEAAESDKGAEK